MPELAQTTMTFDLAEIFRTCASVLTTVVFLGAIPWAYKVHGRLCTIESGIITIAKHDVAMQEAFRRIQRLEVRLATITGKPNGTPVDGA